ncbi:uncharacterized protein PG998_000441 [Apiospora kogelbergensis]|uniref:DUF2423 domain-containing protein n=1 Tax=Apiospora kogelbergensis TaxID=1337665 RepID=A0AAW0QXA4_9PEZI
MAKSSRASTIKANNQRLKRNVFGPVEAARMERLSAKLREIAAQPKPIPEVEMKPVDEAEEAKAAEKGSASDEATMEVDAPKPSKRSERKRIEKHKKPSKIVFPKYKDRVTKKKR